MQSVESATPVDTTFTPGETRSAACLNCGTALTGPYCPQCGQRDIPPYPSLRELVVDAFWELSGWDGRFAATARMLFTKPGALTREFLEGRRSRYISPLRLYLMASLVYFLLAAAASTRGIQPANGIVTIPGVTISTTDTQGPSDAPHRVADATRGTIKSQQPLTGAARDSALKDIQKAPAMLRPLMRRVILDPAGFKRGMLDALPRLLFALLPLFALIVAPFYRHRKYPEHLYFAIHLHAFIFLALSIVALARWIGYDAARGVAQLVVFFWIPTYTTLAFRRAYGGTVGRTLAKEVGIGFIYFWVGIAALLATIYVVAVFG